MNFKSSLRRGLGSAIIELQNSLDPSLYHETVLWCCLHSISYDVQVEGTKGHYLYEATCALGEKDLFRPIIIENFLSQKNDDLSLQLSDTLTQYAKNGNEEAKDALRKKYIIFQQKRVLNKSRTYDEGFQWDDIVRKLFMIDGFSVFKQYAYDCGNILMKNPNHKALYYDFFIDRAKRIFGKKRVERYLDYNYDKVPQIKALLDVLKADKESREAYWMDTISDQISINLLLEKSHILSGKDNQWGNMIPYARRFAKQASQEELCLLAQAAIKESNNMTKVLMLIPFWYKPFPLDIAPLLEYACSENDLLSETAIRVLSNQKDKRIHDLAVILLENDGLESGALSLLKMNYRKSDDKLIGKHVLYLNTIPHHVQMDIKEIYFKHQSKTSGDILQHVYQKGDCAYCRFGIVKAMHHCGILNNEILQECIFDSYEETRKLARRRINDEKPVNL